MKLHFVEHKGDPIIWAYKSQKATLGGFVSVTGILPFLFLPVFPYGTIFQLALLNFFLDIYRTRKRANRWADVIRRIRFVLNAGYWKVQSGHYSRQLKWTWDHFRGQRY
ncbi:MAG: Uncharacterized protein AWU57_501 [Marinobacter sp. T13-3]|nr:MAG: Uncharacterized protein AWU57_501 [Marinobacter sp. T13-3]